MTTVVGEAGREPLTQVALRTPPVASLALAVLEAVVRPEADQAGWMLQVETPVLAPVALRWLEASVI